MGRWARCATGQERKMRSANPVHCARRPHGPPHIQHRVSPPTTPPMPPPFTPMRTAAGPHCLGPLPTWPGVLHCRARSPQLLPCAADGKEDMPIHFEKNNIDLYFHKNESILLNVKIVCKKMLKVIFFNMLIYVFLKNAGSTVSTR